MTMILIGFLLIALIDFLPILKRRQKRSAAAFLVLFLPALTLAVLQIMKIEVPSIMLLLGKVIRALELNY